MSIIALAMLLATNKPPKIVTIVKIEGASFKVRQRGETATVARQSVYINANASHFSRAKRAAEIATNCTVIDSFPINALLNVTLDCSRKPSPADPSIEVKTNE